MSRLVVVGGGIAGLAAAWAARNAAQRAGVTLDVLVLERGPDVGGKAHTIMRDGWLVEGGPSGFFQGREELDLLVKESGLADDVVPAQPASKRRFLYHGGHLREIKPSPPGLARSHILSIAGLMRIAAEPFVPRKRCDDDESVWAFAARRLGSEAADRLVAPMTLGIFAGDARRLSLASAFPRMANLEREHGSLIRGLIARRGRMSAGPLASMRDGMQSLPRALARHGGFTVRCGAKVREIGRGADGWTVMTEGSRSPIAADAVVLAGEPWSSAELMRSVHAAAADALAAVPCPPVTVVGLGFGPEARARIPEGFGVLIARGEGFRMLGNLWETSLYPARGPAGGILVRVMLGGAVDQTVAELDDRETLALVKEEVSRLYGLTVAPVFEEIVRVPRAIPQYEVGHRQKVATVEAAVESLPGIGITGSGLRGVSFGDAAADGFRTGDALGRWLTTQASAAVA